MNRSFRVAMIALCLIVALGIAAQSQIGPPPSGGGGLTNPVSIIQYSGTTSSFPATKQTGSGLNGNANIGSYLADSSAYTFLDTAGLNIMTGLTTRIGLVQQSGGNLVLATTANTAAIKLSSSAFGGNGQTINDGIFGQVSQGISLVNGLNSNITLTQSRVRITGPTGAFSIGGFTAGFDGAQLHLFNTLAQAMTIVNEDASSTAGNRITTLTGANVVLAASVSSAIFDYDATNSRWILMAVRDSSGAH